MIAAPQASHEATRLRALRDACILDTPPSPAFDRLVRLAAQVFRVPIAGITLLDADRQWFKAAVGVSIRETPRNVAFCAHAVQQDRSLIVPDATRDERFRNNPLVTGGPRIRFYAGAPVRNESGLPLGVVAVIDTAPREFSDEQRLLLEDFAAHAAALIDLHRQWRRTGALYDALLHEHTALATEAAALREGAGFEPVAERARRRAA